MTITFMSWPHEDDAELRLVYEEVVAEEVEPEPRDNGTRYLLGSSRIELAHKAAIVFAVPSVVFYEDEPEGYEEG
jgi:hypothetical protein